MSNIDKQALRQLATDAHELGIIKRYSKGLEAQRKFYAAATPLVIRALLDELEADKEQIKTLESRNRRLEGIIDAAEKRIAELEAKAFNPAILDVIAERQRQKSVEGWTPEHDDQYGKSQLLWASLCYLLNTIQPFNRIPMDWPWDSSWWKPTNPRRDLVKAGALILAEIERIDRAAGIQSIEGEG
ncbi:ead/Ea22-like family protein [Citrobacter koseri]